MKKRKIWVIALVIILLTLLAGNTLAYYSVSGTATNVVTSGNIRLKIIETGADFELFPKDGVEVLPGETITKRVSVQNICAHPFWLRLEVTTDSSDTTLSADDVLQILDFNEQDWAKSGKFYYHRTIVRPFETTNPLFTQVKISGAHLGLEDVGTALTITVKASAVQSENNPAANPWEASGWPES